MIRAVEIAKKISKELDKNWLPELENINLHKIFEPIYRLNRNIGDLNTIVAFCILAYDSDSQWIDIRKDRNENKVKILTNLNCNVSSELFQDILSGSHDIVNDVIAHYLNELTDWRWTTVATLIDYHSNMIRFANQKTESEKSFDKVNKDGKKETYTQEFDPDLISKVNKQKGELLEQAIEAREKADKLIADIKKEYVNTDVAVQADFGFSFSDTAKKPVDILSWRAYIKQRNEKREQLKNY